MKKLLFSTEAQLEILKEHIRYFEQVRKYQPTGQYVKGVIGGEWKASQRFMSLIFGKAKFKSHHLRNKNLVSRILFPVKGKSTQVKENPEPGKNKSREKNRGVLKSGFEEESEGSGDGQRSQEKKQWSK